MRIAPQAAPEVMDELLRIPRSSRGATNSPRPNAMYARLGAYSGGFALKVGARWSSK